MMKGQLCKGDLLRVNSSLYADSGDDAPLSLSSNYRAYYLKPGDFLVFLRCVRRPYPEWHCISRYGFVVVYYRKFGDECTRETSRKKIRA